jgi:hypothetical protein
VKAAVTSIPVPRMIIVTNKHAHFLRSGSKNVVTSFVSVAWKKERKALKIMPFIISHEASRAAGTDRSDENGIDF